MQVGMARKFLSRILNFYQARKSISIGLHPAAVTLSTELSQQVMKTEKLSTSDVDRMTAR
jgi:hypothetical protein